MFLRVTRVSFIVITTCGTVLCCLIEVLATEKFQLAERLLPLQPTVLFVLALVANHVTACQSVYVHAHRKDPLAIAHVLGNTLIGVAVAVLGVSYGPTGVGAAYLGAELICLVPLSTFLWLKFRRQTLHGALGRGKLETPNLATSASPHPKSRNDSSTSRQVEKSQ